jgi:hypothetical protein
VPYLFNNSQKVRTQKPVKPHPASKTFQIKNIIQRRLTAVQFGKIQNSSDIIRGTEKIRILKAKLKLIYPTENIFEGKKEQL